MNYNECLKVTKQYLLARIPFISYQTVSDYCNFKVLNFNEGLIRINEIISNCLEEFIEESNNWEDD